MALPGIRPVMAAEAGQSARASFLFRQMCLAETDQAGSTEGDRRFAPTTLRAFVTEHRRVHRQLHISSNYDGFPPTPRHTVGHAATRGGAGSISPARRHPEVAHRGPHPAIVVYGVKTSRGGTTPVYVVRAITSGRKTPKEYRTGCKRHLPATRPSVGTIEPPQRLPFRLTLR